MVAPMNRKILNKSNQSPAFTLIELLVVIAIMAIMLAIGANMLRNTGKRQGMESAIQTLDDMIKEARNEAMARATWTRLVIASEPANDSPTSRNMRYMAIAFKEIRQADQYTTHAQTGDWKLTRNGQFLPAGFYLSIDYCTPIIPESNVDDIRVSKPVPLKDCFTDMRITNKKVSDNDGKTEIFYIEFDPHGRMSTPNVPTRLVIIEGTPDSTKEFGVRPKTTDKNKLPLAAGGLVIWIKGTTSTLKGREQMFGEIAAE